MMRTKKQRKHNNSVNAGSMADIAFLLLIFFLVTTTILMDEGIMVRLPPWSDQPAAPVDEERVLTVKVNGKDQLLVEGQQMVSEQLKDKTKNFITTYLNAHRTTGKKPLVSLQNDRSTSYEMYLQVYNELKAAYNELWDEAAERKYGKGYADLRTKDQQLIRKDIPLIISEAEPTEHMPSS
ncbi:MAG: biopolymer transporter ExbD [Bacteroidota bacterium]